MGRALSNLLLLTQILRPSRVGSMLCNLKDVLFTCPDLQALSLQGAAGSLLAKLVVSRLAYMYIGPIYLLATDCCIVWRIGVEACVLATLRTS